MVSDTMPAEAWANLLNHAWQAHYCGTLVFLHLGTYSGLVHLRHVTCGSAGSAGLSSAGLCPSQLTLELYSLVIRQIRGQNLWVMGLTVQSSICSLLLLFLCMCCPVLSTCVCRCMRRPRVGLGSLPPPFSTLSPSQIQSTLTLLSLPACSEAQTTGSLPASPDICMVLRIWTQGLLCAWQVLNHWATPSVVIHS